MKKNILANFIGRFWGILSNFLFVPLYLKLLGLESYSIISFTLVLNGIMLMMDAGLTATLSREFASSKNSLEERRRIFKTLETCYFVISIIVIILVIMASDFLAFKWLNLEDIAPENVSVYLKIIGIEIGFRLVLRFYLGGFIGLERQIKANMYQIGWGITRNGLVLIPLVFFPSLRLFFIWQTLSTIVYVFIIRMDLSFTLSHKFSSFFKKPKIEKEILIRVWKFAGGMMLISLVAGLNTQMDKLALSKLLSIEILGLYTLAFALSRGLNILSSPVSIAILPRMTSLFTGKKNGEAIKLFNKSYILVSIIIFSFAASMSIYAKEIIWIWTNNLALAEHACKYVPWIVVGTSFLALQNLPFNVAVANGFTKYNNILGITSLIITMPGYWILVKIYGGVGAAVTFTVVQIIITVTYLFLINKKFLKLSIKTLYIKNFLTPIIISFSITIFFNNILSMEGNRLTVLIKIGLTVFTSLFANIILLTPIKELKNKLIKRRLYFKGRFL